MALGRVLGDKFTSKFSFGLVFIGDSKNTSAHSECIPQTPAREEFMTDKAEAVQKARDKERVIATEEAKKKTQVQKEKRKRQSYAAKKQKQVTEVGKCRVFPDCIAWRNKVFQRYDSVNEPPHIFTAPPFFDCQHLKLFRKV